MRAPEFWNIRNGREAAPMIRTLLKPISWIYAWASARRIRTTESYDAGIPVICVGNVTLGGTGKTPVAAYLLNSLRRMGVNVVGHSRLRAFAKMCACVFNNRMKERAQG